MVVQVVSLLPLGISNSVCFCFDRQVSGNTSWKTHTLPFTYTTLYRLATALDRAGINNTYNAAGKCIVCNIDSISTFKTRGGYGTSGSNDYQFDYIAMGY